jgi:hypothetical protein
MIGLIIGADLRVGLVLPVVEDRAGDAKRRLPDVVLVVGDPRTQLR